MNDLKARFWVAHPVKKGATIGANDTINAREGSDVDVAIVVKSITGDYFSTRPLLWRIRREVDDRIEPVLIEKTHDESGFCLK